MFSFSGKKMLQEELFLLVRVGMPYPIRDGFIHRCRRAPTIPAPASSTALTWSGGLEPHKHVEMSELEPLIPAG